MLKLFPIGSKKGPTVKEWNTKNNVDYETYKEEGFKSIYRGKVDNIGAVCGLDCISVFDFDTENGAIPAMPLMRGILPETSVQYTPSGGQHWIYKPQALMYTRYSGILHKLDIRGTRADGKAPGGQIKLYIDVDNFKKLVDAAAELPVDVCYLFAALKRSDVWSALQEVLKAGVTPSPGRNTTLHSLGASLLSGGAPQDLVFTFLENVNSVFAEPLPQKELDAMFPQLEDSEAANKGLKIRQTTERIDTGEINEDWLLFRTGQTLAIYDVKNRAMLKPDAGKKLITMREGHVPVGKKLVPAGEAWWNSVEHHYDGFIIDSRLPYGPVGESELKFNLWKPPVLDAEPKNPDIFFKELLFDRICDKNNAVYQYTIRWLAHLVQYPHVKPGVALVFVDPVGGAGKGIMYKFIKRMLPDGLSMLISDSSHVTGRFTGHLEGKLLLVADEAFFAGSKKDANKMKSMITEGEFMYEHKGLGSYTGKSYFRFMVFSNEEHVINLMATDRRYMVTELTCGRMPYKMAKRMVAAYKDPGIIRGIYEFLMSVDLEGWDISGTIPETRVREEQKLQSLGAVEKWTLEVKETGLVDGTSVIGMKPINLFKAYQDSKYVLEERRIPPMQTFYKRMKKALGGRYEKRNRRSTGMVVTQFGQWNETNRPGNNQAF